MKNKTVFIISVVIFIFAAVFALYLILNKGYIAGLNLVALTTDEVIEEQKPDEIQSRLTLDFEKKFISKASKETIDPIISIDGEYVTDGVELKSSNEDIAKINKDNQVVAVANGKVKITASYDGLEASTDLQVITPIKSMTFTSTSSSVKVGKDLQMKLKLSPSEASTETLEYSSSDEDIATVNQNGIVTGVSAGKVTITVYDKYTEMKKTVNLTIK